MSYHTFWHKEAGRWPLLSQLLIRKSLVKSNQKPVVLSATILAWGVAWSLILTQEPFTWVKRSLKMEVTLLLGDLDWSCHAFCTWDHTSVWPQLRYVRESFFCDEFGKGQVKMLWRKTVSWFDPDLCFRKEWCKNLRSQIWGVGGFYFDSIPL